MRKISIFILVFLIFASSLPAFGANIGPKGGGDTLPVADTTSIVEGSADATKEIRFEVDGLTTSTTRTITVPDKDLTIQAQDVLLDDIAGLSPASGETIEYDGSNYISRALGLFHVTLGGDASFTVAASTFVKIEFDSETFDPLSDYDPTTNYRYTPSIAGKYFIYGVLQFEAVNDGDQIATLIKKNGTTFVVENQIYVSTNTVNHSTTVFGLIDMNGSTDYLELFAFHTSSASREVNESIGRTFFGGYRVGE